MCFLSARLLTTNCQVKTDAPSPSVFSRGCYGDQTGILPTAMCANPRETGSFGCHIRRRPTRKRASDSVVRETATNVEVGARVAIVAATSL